MKRILGSVFLLAMTGSPLFATHWGPYPSTSSLVWPASGTPAPDLPFSSTFGPREKASELFRYDWHRGVDIPLSCDTDLHAIDDGVVRMAGDYPGTYSDRMVQICHPKPGAASTVCGRDLDSDGLMDDTNGDGRTDNAISPDAYYSVYLHLSAVDVVPGQVVTRGQIVAASGDSNIGYSGNCQSGSDGGFDHLHFEIRDGGVNQMNAIHPFVVLPYADSSTPSITISDANLSNPMNPIIETTITTPTGEPDFDRVEVIVYDRSSGSLVEVDRHAFEIMEWNFKYTPDIDTLDTAPDYDGVYDDVGTFGSDAGVIVAAEPFNASADHYELRVTFTSLTGLSAASNLVIKATASDVRGNASEGTVAGPCNAPSITGQPGDQAIGEGASAELTVAASGTAPLTYRWYRGAAPDTSSLVQTGTNSSFTTPSLSQTTEYWVRVSHQCSASVADSRTATVSVAPNCDGPVITKQPGSVAIGVGELVALTVEATGTSLTFQWYEGESGQTSTPIAGATTMTLSVSPPETTTFWARVSNECGSADSTAAVVVVDCDPPVIVSQSADVRSYGGRAVQLSVVAEGTGPLSYQWYRNGNVIEDATGSELDTGPVPVTTTFEVKVTSGCASTTSASIVVTPIWRVHAVRRPH